jgi:sugar-specific transcriptional regulator TrmB
MTRRYCCEVVAVAILENEKVQILVDLGLTTLQARAYLALSSQRTAPLKLIAKKSDIARQDVYRIMPMLEQLGLVEKLISTPVSYRAIPIKDAVSTLLQRKTMEYKNLQEKTESMINNFRTGFFRAPILPDDSQFLVISEKKLLYKTLDEKNSAVEKSLHVVGTWESARSVLFDSELEKFKNALKRGVRIKWITEDHKEDPSTLKISQTLEKNPLFEIRYFAAPIPLQAAIYDEREVTMCIALPPSTDVTSIWSNNPVFTKVALNYWEELWNAALGYCSKKSNRKRVNQKPIT